MLLSTAIPLAAVFVSPVWAQLNVARCAAGFDWNRNSLGQDPCTVGSILDASCRGLTEYTYPPLTDNAQHYLPPRANNSGDTLCNCNTVMYSLYMACASCQEGKIYSWTQWISECPSVYVSQYPANIPQGTIIPRWAYYDITLLPDQTWNDSIAKSIRRRHPKELLRRVDPSPSSDPSPAPPSVSPPASSPDQPPQNPTTYPSYGGTTSTRSLPGATGPKDPTSTANPPGPNTNTNPPDPSTPTETKGAPGHTTTINTVFSGLTISTGDSTNSPRPTSPTGSSSNSLRPTNSVGSSTSSLGPTNPAGSNTNSNGSNAEGGTKVWGVVFALFLCALM